MMKPWLLICALLIGCQSQAPDNTAHVAVATNIYTAALALEEAFEANSAFDITISSGATGQLYAQIIHGAPFDVFMSADQARPALLHKERMTHEVFTYGQGSLVLWSKTGADKDSLSGENFRRIAIANPELAPYGRAAKEVIIALGMEDALKAKIVMGENIGQAYGLVQTGNAELGFAALSQMQDQTAHYWTVPQSLYQPILQDAALLDDENDAAQAFFIFLRSEKAKAILADFGYGAADVD